MFLNYLLPQIEKERPQQKSGRFLDKKRATQEALFLPKKTQLLARTCNEKLEIGTKKNKYIGTTFVLSAKKN